MNYKRVVLIVIYYLADYEYILSLVSQSFFDCYSVVFVINWPASCDQIKKIRNELSLEAAAKCAEFEIVANQRCDIPTAHGLKLISCFKQIADYLNVKRLLIRYNPSCVLLSSCWVDLDSKYYLRLCKIKKISVIGLLLYYKCGPDPANSLSLRNEYLVKNLFQRLFWRSWFPKYLYLYRSRYLLSRLTLVQVMLDLFTRTLDRSPWIAYSDQMDKYIIFDKMFYLYYHRFYADINKYVLCSRRTCSSRERLRTPSANGFSRLCRIVVASIPYDISGVSRMFTRVSSWESHVDSYIRIIKKCFCGISDVKYVVHPSTSIDARHELESKYNIAVATPQEDTYSILSSASLYITSFSTTISWALSRGIPVIDYDYAGLSEDTPFCGYVHTVRSFWQLEDAINGYLAPDSAFWREHLNLVANYKADMSLVQLPTDSMRLSSLCG